MVLFGHQTLVHVMSKSGRRDSEGETMRRQGPSLKGYRCKTVSPNEYQIPTKEAESGSDLRSQEELS